jgi:hypothetical protein
MRRAEIDGVTVLWREAPDAFAGCLVFGVGARDEGIDEIGLTHLTEQLALDPEATELHEFASTMDISISASGVPAGFFTEVCKAFSALDTGRLDEVAGTADPGDRSLSFDIEDPTRDPWGSLLSRRLGGFGFGLLRWPAVDYRAFTVEEVRAHASRFFTSGNAVLALNRPPPDGLTLPLPTGPRADHSASATPVPTTPTWYADEVVAPGIALAAAPGPEALLVQHALAMRTRDAFDRTGKRLWTEEWSDPVGEDRLEIGLSIHFRHKPSPDDHAEVAQVLWQELLKLATEGPTQDEIQTLVSNATSPLEATEQLRIALERAKMTAAYQHAQAIGGLHIAAKKALFGIADEFGDDDRHAAADLTPAAVRDAAATWLRSAAIVVPVGTAVQLDGMTQTSCPVNHFTPHGEALRPSMWQKLRGRGADQLVLSDGAIDLVQADGTVHSFPMADLVLVERGKELLLGNISHGCLVDISGYRGAGKLEDRIPPRRYRVSSD